MWAVTQALAQKNESLNFFVPRVFAFSYAITFFATDFQMD